MHILVTRPEPGATELRHRLEAAGHRVTLAPMLTIEADAGAVPPLDQFAALIATSRNGLRSLLESPHAAEARALPLFVVGPGTARLAREAGFETIIAGNGTAADLVPLIVAQVGASGGRLLHLAGEEVAFDLKGALESAGLHVTQPALYRSKPADRIAPEGAAALRAGDLDAIVVMSPRTADVLVARLKAEGLTEPARDLVFFCLSEAVARQLAPLGPVRIEICPRPNLDALLSHIARLTETSG